MRDDDISRSTGPVPVRTALNIAFVGFALVWAVLRSGTGLLPDVQGPLSAAFAWPMRLPGPFEGFLSDSPIGIVVFRALGLETQRDLYLLHLLAVMIAIAGMGMWAWLVAGRENSWRAARLTALSPIVAVLLVWVGAYDPFTIIAWVAVLFAWISRNRVLMVTAGVLLGFQHFEQAVLGLLALWCAWLATGTDLPSRLARTSPLWIAPGIILGKAVLLAIFKATDQALTSREEWLGVFFREWLAVGANIAPLLIWSLFAGFWAVVVYLLLTTKSRTQLFALVGMFGFGLVGLLASGDRPRVFIVIMAPAVALLTVAFVRKTRGLSRESHLVEAIVWLAPPVIFWGKDVANENVIDLMTIMWMYLSAT